LRWESRKDPISPPVDGGKHRLLRSILVLHSTDFWLCQPSVTATRGGDRGLVADSYMCNQSTEMGDREIEFLIRHDPADWNAQKLGFSPSHDFRDPSS